MADLADQLLAGNRRALAQAITRVEDDGPEAHAFLGRLYPHTGRAHIIGVTGTSGTGKSTLVNALARSYRVAGQTVGIIAVDPTSPFSGGALLGDRVRMRDLAGDPGIFIRSMATRGSLGGLANATGDVISILDAAGFDRILVETVGVGQTEVDIASAAHTTVLVQAPGLGDELQAIKAGILEIADLFAVNKADREGADQAVSALQMMQGLAPSAPGHQESALSNPPSGFRHPWPEPGRRQPSPGSQPDGSWIPPITKTVAIHGEGIETLRIWIEAHRTHLHATGQLSMREMAHASAILDNVLCHQLKIALLARLPDRQLADLVAAIAHRERDPYTVASQILSSVIRNSSPINDT